MGRCDEVGVVAGVVVGRVGEVGVAAPELGAFIVAHVHRQRRASSGMARGRVVGHGRTGAAPGVRVEGLDPVVIVLERGRKGSRTIGSSIHPPLLVQGCRWSQRQRTVILNKQRTVRRLPADSQSLAVGTPRRFFFHCTQRNHPYLHESGNSRNRPL